MNGVLGTGMTFWEFIFFFVLAIVSIIAIRISFDINKFLDRRDRKLQQKLKNACTHIDMKLISSEGNKANYEVRSLFESPPGMFKWQCQRCGATKNHDNDYGERAAYYAEHPDEYMKQQKKFDKLLKKAGYR